jgi:hypothetical protein
MYEAQYVTVVSLSLYRPIVYTKVDSMYRSEVWIVKSLRELKLLTLSSTLSKPKLLITSHAIKRKVQ